MQSDRNLRHFGSVAPWAERDQARADGRKTYSTGKPCANGHLALRRVASRRCVACENAKMQKRSAEDAARYYAIRRASIEADRGAEMLRNSRKSAKQRGIQHSITAADISFGENCPCCGIEFDPKVSTIRTNDTACPSLDRLDNTKGYVPGNVHVICLRCNWVKGGATLREIRNVVAYMESHLL